VQIWKLLASAVGSDYLDFFLYGQLEKGSLKRETCLIALNRK
jgi:hypothetical protein